MGVGLVNLGEEGVIVDVFDDKEYDDDSLVATSWESYSNMGADVTEVVENEINFKFEYIDNVGEFKVTSHSDEDICTVSVEEGIADIENFNVDRSGEFDLSLIIKTVSEYYYSKVRVHHYCGCDSCGAGESIGVDDSRNSFQEFEYLEASNDGTGLYRCSICKRRVTSIIEPMD